MTGEPPSLTVLVAPSGLKEALSAPAVTRAIAAGAKRAIPTARILEVPMVDGGEGFTEALVERTGGRLHRVRVTGPVGIPVDAMFGMLGGDAKTTAVIEIAAAAGLALVPISQRDPRHTTSTGVGELIVAAIDHGADDILIGCGDSGVNDAGAGVAQAFGIRLLDAAGSGIGRGGAALARLKSVDLSKRDPRLGRVRIRAAVNWQNVLLGERGVTRVYAAQKGASPQQVAELEHALENFANCIEAATGVDIRHAPGTGASGGLGAGLVAFAGATLHPRFDLLLGYTDFEKHLAEADIVLTAEGEIDGRSVLGKIPGEVGRRAAARGIPVIALAGVIGQGSDVVLNHGIDAFASIADGCYTREDSIRNSASLLERAAESAMRMVAAGMRIRPRAAASPSARADAPSPDGPAARRTPAAARGDRLPGRAPRSRETPSAT
jgi:glycerate kinase